MRPTGAAAATPRQRARVGDRTLSKDEWAALQTLREATNGNIPTVRKIARQLRKSGKGVEETLAGIDHPRFSCRCGPLHRAEWAGRLEMCRFLVDELRLNVNAPCDDDTCEIAELLLSRGAYVDPMCTQGTTLNIAAKNGNVRMLELLLRHQANPNTDGHLIDTPLSYAISTSSLKCMELLIKAGANVNAGRPVITPLILAASYDFTCGIKCLLEAGADANITDELGRTAAEVAATKGRMDCVKILYPVTTLAGSDNPLLNANGACALKMQGDAAFEENDYADALALYTKAMEIDPDDSTLYAKRSLCWLHMSEEDKALDDAYTYRNMMMDLSNSCHEQAAALIPLEYPLACQALVSALKLDLRSDDLD
ncbi:unnamed protein product [Alopecurus aequalis]